MLVVDNCTLSALQKINRLSLLKCLFSEVFVPKAVQEEFSQRWAKKLNEDPFILADTVPNIPDSLKNEIDFIRLGKGEQEGILWSLQTKSQYATDDLKVRKICTKLGIAIIGTLGLCKLGYLRGCFENLETYYKAIDALAEDLYLSPDLIEYAKRV